MRLFHYQQDKPYYGAFAAQIHELILSTVLSIEPFSKKDEIVQTAMFLFHYNMRILTYQLADRFMYALGSILLASKMNDQIVYCDDIVLKFRKSLRALRNRQGTDDEAKIRLETRNMMQAEIVIMINIGFNLNVCTGMTYLKEWERQVGDSTFYEQIARTITKLYQTNLCLYCQPENIAFCGLSMAVKDAGLTPELCQWKPAFYDKFISKKAQIEEVHNEYSTRLSLNNG